MRHVRMQLLFKKMLAMRPLRTWFRREILDVAVSIYFYQVLHFDLRLSSDDILQHPLSQPHWVLQKESQSQRTINQCNPFIKLRQSKMILVVDINWTIKLVQQQ